MVWPRDRHKFGICLWFHHLGHWFSPPWLGCGTHPGSCRCRFHDRLSDQYHSKSDPWAHGHHRLRVCPSLSAISSLPDHPSSNSTRAATYHVIINTLKGLGRTKMDAAFGLVGLFSLYAIRMTCDYLSRRYPRRGLHCPYVLRVTPSNYYHSDKMFFFISAFRSAFVIVVLTLASWLYTRHRKSAKGTYPIKILQNVPRGLKHVGTPNIDSQLLSALAPKLPVATIIMLLEHIAISKCKLVHKTTF